MQVNDKLTQAARAHNLKAFDQLSAEQQTMMVEWVLGQKDQAEELARANLRSMSALDLEDLLNSMGDTTQKANAGATERTFHADNAEA